MSTAMLRTPCSDTRDGKAFLWSICTCLMTCAEESAYTSFLHLDSYSLKTGPLQISSQTSQSSVLSQLYGITTAPSLFDCV